MFKNHLRAYLWTHLKNIDLDLYKEAVVKNIDFQVLKIHFLCLFENLWFAPMFLKMEGRGQVDFKGQKLRSKTYSTFGTN